MKQSKHGTWSTGTLANMYTSAVRSRVPTAATTQIELGMAWSKPKTLSTHYEYPHRAIVDTVVELIEFERVGGVCV